MTSQLNLAALETGALSTYLSDTPGAVEEYLTRRDASPSELRAIFGQSRYGSFGRETRTVALRKWCQIVLRHSFDQWRAVPNLAFECGQKAWIRSVIVEEMLAHPYTKFEVLGLIADKCPELEDKVRQAMKARWERIKTDPCA